MGAPRKALLNLGYPHKSIDYVEIDEKAVRTYNALYDHLHKPQSVIGWNLRPDILVHGSPCQDFSRAGKRLGGNDEDKTRSSLMWETLRIIKSMGEWKPKVVIWENVKGVLAKDMIHSFNKYFIEMERLGYTSNYDVLDARHFGIPQTRERVFVVSMLNGEWFDFSRLRTRPMQPIQKFLENNPDDKYTVTSQSMLSRIRGSSTFVPPSERTFKGSCEVIDQYAYTVTTRQDRSPNSGVVKIADNKYRLLTERECWRLMGFDDEDFEKVAAEHPSRPQFKNAALYHQAGNSIVVQVLEAIFEQVFKVLEGIPSAQETAENT
ncbi:DNA cytosine methyltransferase [Macrococcus brunensis]|uniref:DNA cytosine methyltransferase n=1 Tax=Macrococcus brunensis TaxID=198483 RepID=UPI001EF0FA3C|nr:DNA (cytosine-5-)-methyltransferase [Macrococcus brunensis]ULG73069.1 DNA (cytosine-5-)-methyltransferase [Macrococcus brunensis]